MPYFQSDDVDIFFEASASNGQPRLLFISGTGGDLRKKPDIFDSPLTNIFQLASFDQRGLGQSGKPDRSYSMSDYADDALGVLDKLGWDKAHVVGLSFGGMVAQELAINHSERIDRLVLCCTSSGGKGGSSYPLHELDALDETARAHKMLAISDLRCTRQWIEEHPGVYEEMLEQTLLGFQFAADEPNHALGARRQLEARKDHDTYERLSAISCSTLVCGGKYDGLATPQNMKAMTDKLPRATLQFFDGGHMFLLQDNSAWQRVVEFLLGDELPLSIRQ